MQKNNKTGFKIFWIIISMMTFIAIELFLGGFVAQFIKGRFVGHTMYIRIEIILILASYFIGGLLIGFISPSIRIFEPAVGAALAVVITFAYSFFTPVRFYSFGGSRVIYGSIIAFVLAIVGADLGERLAAKLGNRTSKDYLDGT